MPGAGIAQLALSRSWEQTCEGLISRMSRTRCRNASVRAGQSSRNATVSLNGPLHDPPYRSRTMSRVPFLVPTWQDAQS